MDIRVLDRQGTKLAVLDTGGDGEAIVLVHGWCCDRSFFHPQVEYFSNAGYRILAVDLRGHGESDAPPGSYGMQVFADDVAWSAREIGVKDPVIVGHSMGGVVAFDVAARYPDLISGVVMIDSSVVRSIAALRAIDGLCDALAGPDRVRIAREYVHNALFIATDDPARRDSILNRMAATPAHVMLGAMIGLRDYDPSYASGLINAPCVFISADQPIPRTDIGALQALVPQLMTGRTVGSGHFCQLEVPQQVNAMIDRFLTVRSASART
ncbi:MAG: alpha/beta hydrolase [Rhizobiaceae bacterium]|nr:alpha/beta hydrolase [Rhizobiaceae bacterium]